MTDKPSVKNPHIHMLAAEFLKNAKAGDSNAGLDISRLFLGEVPTDSIELILSVAEILMLQSTQLGSDAARDYLENTWPEMKDVLRGRFVRKGLQD
ncbi:hypothetical protein [Pseudomonas paralcaligenes]|uniref:hypothetical protein n=1 Tax=Pseudomonas paralcaligenes TaxID=2772558 RepID=UPI001C7E200B|nr:hypothetical protein [Pseudomonas paralcaligenes]